MSFAVVHQSKNKVEDTKILPPAKLSSHYNNLTRNSHDSDIHLQRTIGNQAVQRFMHSGTRFDFEKIGIQPKLKISQPDDVYEQEADKVAEEVMRTFVSTPINSLTIPDSEERIDRKCAACETEKEEEEESLGISRKQSPNIAGVEGIDRRINEVKNVVAAGGSPLDANTKELMEFRFGYDFNNIRIHTGETAARSARSVNALAYTIGKDIVFGDGQYRPDTLEGRRLLAHELTHAIQQDKVSTVTRQSTLEDNKSRRETTPLLVTHTFNSVLSRKDDYYGRGAMFRCKEIGVPCLPAWWFDGSFCELIGCSRAATANLPFAISPGVCVFRCEDGKICSCVMVGTSTNAICTFRFCSNATLADTQEDIDNIAIAAADATRQQLTNPEMQKEQESVVV
jgi:hypothetical protein